jgi:hypothetical protein
MWKVDFWRDAIERAIKTFAQSVIAMFSADTLNVLKADFGQLLAVSLGAALISLLTSLASSTVGDDSPSLVFPKTPKE